MTVTFAFFTPAEPKQRKPAWALSLKAGSWAVRLTVWPTFIFLNPIMEKTASVSTILSLFWCWEAKWSLSWSSLSKVWASMGETSRARVTFMMG